MSHQFYKTESYRNKQSVLTKTNWQNGVFNSLRKKEKRLCAKQGCGKTFQVILSNPKIYCSHSCAASVNNIKRGKLSEKVKLKIASTLRGRESLFKGIKKVAPEKVVCAQCKNIFVAERWAHRKYCSTRCAMSVIGGKPTSPKAARGISGIREDISKDKYFYSRWEANFARLLNLLKIKWTYQYKTFDLGGHTYTPDFYLPDYDIWIEIKNFLSAYSRKRDSKFRELYPDLKLILILKDDYLKLQDQFATKIKEWEYS